MVILTNTNIRPAKQPAGVIMKPLINLDDPEIQLPVASCNNIRKRSSTMPWVPSLGWWLSTALLLTLAIAVLVFLCHVLAVETINVMRTGRYRGSCAISSTRDADYVVMKEAPTAMSWLGEPAPSPLAPPSENDLVDSKILYRLIEDMSIDDDVENIYVHDGPRSFRVVHDFNENYTVIMSPARCFLMEMMRQFVLEPESLIASFRNESALELGRAHTVFRATLPAGPARWPAAVRPCLADARPTYRLALEDWRVLQKRSVEYPSGPRPAHGGDADAAVDFVQFSGKHLQRITISNIDDVLRYERTRADADAAAAAE